MTEFEKLYKSLNKAQKQAVDAIDGPVMVVAGPGTGKTQILAARIANILNTTDTQPYGILCLTYTDAGVVAMRERLLSFIGPVAYRINIHTFHSLCNEIIQYNTGYFGYTGLNPASDLDTIEIIQEIIDELPNDHILKRLKGEIYYDVADYKNLFKILREENFNPEELTAVLNRSLQTRIDDGEFEYKRNGKDYKKGDRNERKYNEAKLETDRLIAAIAEFKNFENKMKERRLYDFTDMITWVVNAFKTDKDFLLNYQERFLYLLVDEYQDTNGAQNQLVELLAEYWDIPNLFVVGDDDQSIYRFQGANIGNILGFEERYRANLNKTVLTENYRSSQPILHAAGGLISRNTERLPDISKELVSSHPAVNAITEKPSIAEYFNPLYEAVGTGQTIQKLHENGVPYSEIAVLYRNHRQIELLARFFRANNIPYNSKRRVNILDELLIQKLLKILTYIDAEARKPHSGEYLLFEILNFDFYNIPALETAKLSIEVKSKNEKWRNYLAQLIKSSKPDLFAGQAGMDSRSEMKRLASDLEYWIGQVNNITVPQLVEKIIAKGGILSYVMQADDKRWQMQMLRTFFDFVKEEAAKNPRLKLSDLLKTIERYATFNIAIEALQIMQVPDSVNLITAHSSKGLEFEHVFIIGCQEKTWFNSRGDNDFKLTKLMAGTETEGSDEEENRRLFYVGMTRAKKQLTISYYNQTLELKAMEKLRFIAELEADGNCNTVKPNPAESDILEFEMQYYSDNATPDFDLIDHDYLDALLAGYTMSATHLNSYMKCPVDFYFNHVLKVPSAKSENASFGTAMHAALEHFFKAYQNNGINELPPVEVLTENFEKSMYVQRDSFTDDAYKRRLAQGLKILPEYYKACAEQWKSEKYFSVERNMQNIIVKGIPVKGKLDRLVFDGNDAYVIDFKTGNHANAKLKCQPPHENPDPDKREQVQGGDYWRQMVFYHLLIENDNSNKWSMSSGEMNFVEPLKDGSFAKEKFVISPDYARIVTEQIQDTYSKIKAHEFSKGCNEENCEWCRFVRYYLKKETLVTEQLPGSSLEEN